MTSIFSDAIHMELNDAAFVKTQMKTRLYGGFLSVTKALHITAIAAADLVK